MVAWLALLALVLNLTMPARALSALPPADIFATALCHAPGSDAVPGQQEQQAPPQQAPCATCPLCVVLGITALPVLPEVGVTLPLPRSTSLAQPRAPPAAAALPAQARPPGARGPPHLT